MQHRRPDVQARPGTVQDARRSEVDEEPGNPGCEHPAADDAGRVGEPPDRRPDDPAAEHDEHERVRQGGEHLGAAPAEAPLRRRRPHREPGGEEGQPERERVRDHVRRVGEERQRIGGHPDDGLDAREGRHEGQCDCERPPLSTV